MREIVAAMIGTTITSNPRMIADAVAADSDVQFLDRQHMAFMAALDLGVRWQKLAQGPTFFCVDNDGIILPPQEETHG